MSASARVLLARNAMATRFEIALHGEDPVALRAAGEAALDEIQRVEAMLNVYEPTSEIAHVNARAAYEAVRVSNDVFGLLEHARRLTETTLGAFDVTIGPLIRCWGLHGEQGRVPDSEELAQIRGGIGMHRVIVDPEAVTVRFAATGMMLDLGAIGKGYAIERAVEVLREAGVHSAFLHGGTSTAYGLGTPPDGGRWKVAVAWPRGPAAKTDKQEFAIERNADTGPERDTLAIIELHDEALSVSAPSGKSFRVGDRLYGHVFDPRTAEPAAGAAIAAVALPSATAGDALSTALLALGLDGSNVIVGARPEARTLVAEWADLAGGLRVRAHRITPASSHRQQLCFGSTPGQKPV